MPAPIFKDKKDFPGLQAADYFAWEQAFYLKEEKRLGRLPELRDSFNRLLAIPRVHLQSDLETLLHICEKKGVPIKRAKIILP